MPPSTSASRVSTGLVGLDAILDGGFVPNRLYLAEGAPGTGKTTLALQFLLEGARRGEKGLYVTLAETKEELEDVARSHGWTLDDIEVFELVPPEASLDREREQTLLHPSEVELGETTQLIFDRVTELAPVRVVFDSLSEMRLLARNSLRYRRQVLALKHFFRGRNCTVLLLDDSTAEEEAQLHSVPHGVLQLEQLTREYGTERRRLRVVKMRGVAFRGGYHDFVIATGGITVYPRIALETRANELGPIAKSGIEELDVLLGGGLVRGTNTLLIGPSGSGKTTLALQYAMAAAQRGEKAALFAFDETLPTLRARCLSFGMPIQDYIGSGLLRLQQMDPAEMSPGEFLYPARAAVERDGASVVIIDTLNGYLAAMPEEHFLVLQLHELLSWLNHRGVLTILIMAQHGILGDMKSPLDLSYLSDTVLLLRYFEASGMVRQAISVVKKRFGAHERVIREYKIQARGISVGPPLAEFHGILSGIPSFAGAPKKLLPNG